MAAHAHLAVALVLVLAACGGDDTEAQPTTTAAETPTTTEPETTTTTVDPVVAVSEWFEPALPELNALLDQTSAASDAADLQAAMTDVADAAALARARLEELGGPPAFVAEIGLFVEAIERIETTTRAVGACTTSCSTEVEAAGDALQSFRTALERLTFLTAS